MSFSIGGLVPLTCIDYPGHIACVVFTQFCPLRCDYCHNKHLLEVNESKYSTEYLLNFLEERKNFLEGVVFSGGEPLAQKGLKDVMLEVKKLGLKIALHTSGFYYENLANVIELIDWVGLDIKAPKDDYIQITHTPNSGAMAFKSLDLILSKGINYEVRTTVYPYYFTKERIFRLANELNILDVTNYVLQEYRPLRQDETPPTLQQILSERDVEALTRMFKKFHIRYANQT